MKSFISKKDNKKYFLCVAENSTPIGNGVRSTCAGERYQVRKATIEGCNDYTGCSKITYIFIFYDENKKYLSRYIGFNIKDVKVGDIFYINYIDSYLILSQLQKAEIYPNVYVIPTTVKINKT